jgi:flagellin-like protein
MTDGGNRDAMRRFRRSERGLSEIVGTLMLVVIVVTAATLLAAFVATYQQQLQTEQAFTHDQSLESLKVLGLITALNKSRTAFENINFTLASEYINPSTVLGVSIDNVPLKSFWWENLANHTWQETTLGASLSLAPEQEIFVSTNTSLGNDSFLSTPPLPNEYLKFDVYTVLQNDFSRVFLPPVALSVVTNLTLSPSNWATLLDGSESFQPGGNASIVDWNWSVVSFALPGVPAYFVGEEAEVSPAFATGVHYWVNLTVTNSDGLLGTARLVATGGP